MKVSTHFFDAGSKSLEASRTQQVSAHSNTLVVLPKAPNDLETVLHICQ